MSNLTILLVEDNIDDILLTKRAFKRHNFRGSIVTATDGIEALDYLFCRGDYADRPSVLPDLVLLDLKMPRSGGLDLLKHMRADERTRLVPVIMLTSSSEDVDVRTSYENGANSFLQKPVDFDEFVKTAEVIELYWLRMNKGAR